MWSLKFLTGPQMGQVIQLKNGKNLIGRGDQCDIRISTQGVSKEHAEIQVYPDKMMVADLRSSNGTFVNGIKIQNSLIKLGDKVSFFDVIAEVVPVVMARAAAPAMHTQTYSSSNMPMPPSQSAQVHFQAPQYQSGADSHKIDQSPPRGSVLQDIQYRIEEYLERVALPGVYKIAEVLEFKLVLISFVAIFIFVVTLLSLFPMIKITRESIEKESFRRAESLAKNLALTNQRPLLEGSISALNTYQAEAEEGVKQVMIVQQSDGMILAPASRAGTTPNLPFVHRARRENKSQAMVIDAKTIGASYPIGIFNPNTGEPEVKAHAIIIYDLGSLAFDNERVLSLFMQTLVLASIVGFFLYYFMYKLVEFPLVSLNKQLDMALREKKDNLEIKFQYPALQSLVGNLNSLLTRYINGENSSDSGSAIKAVTREMEALQLVHLVGYPAIAIHQNLTIISVNHAFELLTRLSQNQIVGQNFMVIPDGSLQQNIQNLIQRSNEDRLQIHSDQLEMSGHPCVLTIQSYGSNEIEYYLITVSPAEGGS